VRSRARHAPPDRLRVGRRPRARRHDGACAGHSAAAVRAAAAPGLFNRMLGLFSHKNGEEPFQRMGMVKRTHT